MTIARRYAASFMSAVAVLSLSACSPSADAPASADAAASGATNGELVVLSHDSFDLDEALLAQFTKETDLKVTIQPVGDGGTLANQLVLTKDNPLGDVVYGLDNTVSYRLAGAGVIEDAQIESPNLELDFAAEPGLVPIDHGDVCVNLDKTWFAEKSLPQPTSFEDLAKPEYKDLLVALNPATSTPGMAFMLATINHFGEDGWVDYWKSLKANGTKVAEGWSDAFASDYSAGDGAGPYPMMVSYGSSPAYFVNDAKTESSNAALPDTCYRQVEYAGVLHGTKNPEGAKKFIEFMLSHDVQEAISAATYMYPASKDAHAPEDLVKFGPLSEKVTMLPADKIAQNAESWLKAWQESVNG